MSTSRPENVPIRYYGDSQFQTVYSRLSFLSINISPINATARVRSSAQLPHTSKPQSVQSVGELTHQSRSSCSPPGPRRAWAPGGWAVGAVVAGGLAPASSFSVSPSVTPETPVKHTERQSVLGWFCQEWGACGTHSLDKLRGTRYSKGGCQMASLLSGVPGQAVQGWGLAVSPKRGPEVTQDAHRHPSIPL